MNLDSPWISFLASQNAQLDATACSIAFGDAREELRHAREGLVLVPLTHLGSILVSGEDAGTLLHNLLSNDVKKLGENAVQHNSFNSPKGRMLASFLAWKTPAGYRLTISADIAAAMQKKLSMYVLRAKAKVSDVSSERALLGLSGKAVPALEAAGLPAPSDLMSVAWDADSRISVARLDADRYVIDAPLEEASCVWESLVSSGAKPAGTNAWRWLDIQAGFPLITAANQEEFVAQMVNFELLGGVDFKKGCYPGQEIVARTQYLGKLKKRMYRAHVDGDVTPAVNADLYSAEFGEQSCGKVLSVAPSPEGGFDILAVMQISARESNDVHLASPDGPPLRFEDLPYAVS